MRPEETRDLSHAVSISTHGELMKSAIAVFAVTASAFALPAAAQMNMSAFYVGGSLGQSKFKNSCTGLPAGLSCDEKDTPWRILAGYQINPNIAADVRYHNFRQAQASRRR